MQAIGLMFLAYRVKFPLPAHATETTTGGVSVVVVLFVHCIMYLRVLVVLPLVI